MWRRQGKRNRSTYNCIKKVLKDRRKAIASKGQNGHSCMEQGLVESCHRDEGQEGEATRVKKVRRQKVQVNKKKENGK